MALANSFGKGHLKYPEKPYGMSERENNIEQQVIDIKARIKQVNNIIGSTS